MIIAHLLPYQCPVLAALKISPEVPYELIFIGVQSLRTLYQSHKSLGNDCEAFRLSSILSQGETLLSFMRTNRSTLEALNNSTQKLDLGS